MSINKLQLALADIETELVEMNDSGGKSYMNPDQQLKHQWETMPLDWSVFRRTKRFVSAFVGGKVTPQIYANDRRTSPVLATYNIIINGNLGLNWEDIFGDAFGVDSQVFRNLFPISNNYNYPVFLNDIQGISFMMPSNRSMIMNISIQDKELSSVSDMNNIKRKLKRFFKGIEFDGSQIHFSMFNKESIDMNIPAVPLGDKSPIKKKKKKKGSAVVPMFKRSFL